MAVGWEAADDDLENLLNFDDLEIPRTPDTGNNSQPCNVLSHSPSSKEALSDSPNVSKLRSSSLLVGRNSQKHGSLHSEDFSSTLARKEGGHRARSLPSRASELDEITLKSQFEGRNADSTSASGFGLSRSSQSIPPITSARIGSRNGTEASRKRERELEREEAELDLFQTADKCTYDPVTYAQTARGDPQHPANDVDDVRVQSRGQKLDKHFGGAKDWGSLEPGRVVRNSQAASVPTRERVHQDENQGSGRTRPPNSGHGETFPALQRTLNRTQGASVRNTSVTRPLEAGSRANTTQVNSSRGLPVGLEAAHKRTDGIDLENETMFSPESSPSRESNDRGLSYKIPGPAGALQRNFRRRKSTDAVSASGRKTASYYSSTPDAAAIDFLDGPWLSAMEHMSNKYSGRGTYTAKVTISDIISHKSSKPYGRITELVAVIKAITPNGFGDMSVNLKDPTGTINGSIHRGVLTESEYGKEVAVGAVIVIRKVAVFTPRPGVHYLNITVDNVDQVFGKDTEVPRTRSNGVHGSPSTKGKGHTTAQSERRDCPSPHSGNRQAPLHMESDGECNNPRWQGVANNSTHLRDSEIGEEAHANPDTPGSGSAKKSKQSAFLPTILEESVGAATPDSTQNADILVGRVTNRLCDGFEEEKATQDVAKAKAAGWDLGEDVELLLADDLDNFF